MALSLNDISVLYPLPTSADDAAYLGAKDDGAHGQLLPRDLFAQIPTFPVNTDETLVMSRLRVVSLRFDACGGGPDDCRPELRLVMQPISDDGWSADAAVHLFYEVDDFGVVVSALRDLRVLEPETLADAPLDVHPSLFAQGVDGTYGTSLRELVLSLAGEDQLRRMTFFLRAPSTTPNWFMGGFEVESGEAVSMEIEGVRGDLQRVVLFDDGDPYTYEVSPVGARPEDGRVFFSTEAMAAATDAERQEAMASYLRVENPAIYVPDQLSCVGCHLSTYVTTVAARDYGLVAAAFPDDAFTTTRTDELTGGASENPSSLRAFGWFGDTPMISRRTLNETAHALDRIEAEYPESR